MTSRDSGLRLVDYLNHIEEASRLAREYVAGISKESFLKDRRTQQAVVLNRARPAATRAVPVPGAARWPALWSYFGLFGHF